MTNSLYLSDVILLLTAAVLFYAALNDLKHFTIRNELILLLVILFLIHSFISGRWTSLLWTLGFVFSMFLIMLFFYSRNLMGGGDVKLLTVALMWVGIDCALAFSVLLLLFALLHTVATKLHWVSGHKLDDGRARIPFAPSIAAALIGTFMLGCLQPVR